MPEEMKTYKACHSYYSGLMWLFWMQCIANGQSFPSRIFITYTSKEKHQLKNNANKQSKHIHLMAARRPRHCHVTVFIPYKQRNTYDKVHFSSDVAWTKCLQFIYQHSSARMLESQRLFVAALNRTLVLSIVPPTHGINDKYYNKDFLKQNNGPSSVAHVILHMRHLLSANLAVKVIYGILHSSIELELA